MFSSRRPSRRYAMVLGCTGENVSNQAQFEPRTRPAAGSGVCALDEPAPLGHEIEVANTGTLALRGWAFSDKGEAVPDTVFVELFSECTTETEVVDARRTMRRDVADHFGDPGLMFSGFAADVSMGAFRYGRYAVHLVQRRLGITFRLENILRVVVLPETYESAARSGLARKFLRGNGIEIGALQRKLLVPLGCTIQYVDRMNLEELRSHYPELDGVSLQAPDVIDDGEKLARFGHNSLDFVVANHFIEHCENPIGAMH